MSFLGEWAKKVESQLDKTLGLETPTNVTSSSSVNVYPNLEQELSPTCDLEEPDPICEENDNDAKKHLRSIIRDLKTQISSMKVKHSDELESRDSSMRKARDVSQEIALALSEKDKQIAAVMEEGRVLAQKQSKMEASFKQSVALAIERDKTIADLTTKLDDYAKENHILVDTLDRQQLQIEKSDFLLNRVGLLEDEVILKTEEGEGFKDVITTLETSLEKANQQLAMMTDERDALSHSLCAASQKVEHSTEDMKGRKEREDQLMSRIRQFQNDIDELDLKYRMREAQLTCEIDTLREHLSASEKRNEILASSIPETTRPLIRQLDALKISAKSKSDSWKELENSLRCQIAQLEVVVDSNREELLTLQANLKRSELLLTKERTSLHSVNGQLAHHMEREDQLESKVSNLNSKLCELQSQVITLNTTIDEQNDLISNDREHYLNDLEGKYVLIEDLEKTASNLKERIIELESSLEKTKITHHHSSGSVVAPIPSQYSRNYGPRDVLNLETPKDTHNEINSFKKRIAELELIRDTLAEELVSHKSHLRTLAAQIESFPELKASFDDLTVRHDTALELLGDREEQLQTLTSDFQEVKQVFRVQISDLLDQVEQLQQTT